MASYISYSVLAGWSFGGTLIHFLNSDKRGPLLQNAKIQKYQVLAGHVTYLMVKKIFPKVHDIKFKFIK